MTWPRMFRWRRRRPTIGRVAIGPVRVGAHTVTARPCRPDDAETWREVRMRNERVLAPYWPRSDRPWADRHTRNEWIRELLEARSAERAGRRVSFAIDIDGRFAGQCTLSSIDHRLATAEVGVWVDSHVAHRAVGTLATGLVVDHGIARLGLRRIFAPAATTNVAAQKAMLRSRFRRECRLPDFFDVGDGESATHELWVLDAVDLPDGGLTTLAIRSTAPDAGALRVPEVTRRARRSRVLSTRVDDASSACRFHLGRAQSALRLRRRPTAFPAELRVPLPAESATRHRATHLSLALRQGSPVSRNQRTLTAGPTEPVVLETIRPDSWFGRADSVTYHLRDGRRSMAWLRLVGAIPGPGPAEIAVRPVTDRWSRRHDALESTVAAVRVLVSMAWAAGITTVATGTDPNDEFATAVALGSGFARLGQLTDFTIRNGDPGSVDVWAVNAAPAHAHPV